MFLKVADPDLACRLVEESLYAADPPNAFLGAVPDIAGVGAHLLHPEEDIDRVFLVGAAVLDQSPGDISTKQKDGEFPDGLRIVCKVGLNPHWTDFIYRRVK